MRLAVGAAAALVCTLLALTGCGPSRADPVLILGDSRVETFFVDELGGSFVLVSAKFVVDGRVVGERVASEDDRGTVFEFPAITVPAGEHEIKAHARYRGKGHGIFSYLEEYKFDVESSHEFSASPHRTISLTAVCYERGGPTTELSERPAIRWIEKRPEERR
jgi:hypothetical protein